MWWRSLVYCPVLNREGAPGVGVRPVYILGVLLYHLVVRAFGRHSLVMGELFVFIRCPSVTKVLILLIISFSLIFCIKLAFDKSRKVAFSDFWKTKQFLKFAKIISYVFLLSLKFFLIHFFLSTSHPEIPEMTNHNALSSLRLAFQQLVLGGSRV